MKYPFPVRNYIDSLVVSDYYLDVGNDFLSRSIREHQGSWAPLIRHYYNPSSTTRSQSGKRLGSNVRIGNRHMLLFRYLSYSSSRVSHPDVVGHYGRVNRRYKSTSRSLRLKHGSSISRSRTTRSMV